ncbi:hypothetical protein F5B22DRAFT_582550 [Xylaria bambusicola]|uniref:uncharacterized protein n=1 Tax=Xylaria bambusicola TaxID=326684 RepID=UPI002008A244|nr:uncharacterized protein F5B22DRAFT_582550 [Xylaria bambusicola]KAI0527841.1 hypothetical protein F5B22DRAFT_582550 [Xylaria bambusicola]
MRVPEKVEKTFTALGRCAKEAGRDAWSDVSTRWRLIPLIFWFGFLFTTLFILLEMSLSSHFEIPRACRPDGTFSPFVGYNYWDASGFFQINIPFGSYSFTAVKIIDTVWDVVIGRLGQSILAYFAYSTFADYATLSMETAPITYTTFIILFIESGPTFMSVYRLIRDFMLYRRLRSTILTIWAIFSMLFILTWPTLIAAMSGYSPEVGAYVKDIDTENLVKYNEFRLLAYIIHDGERINLTTDYQLPAGPPFLDSWDILLNDIHETSLHPTDLFDTSDCVTVTEGDDLTLCFLLRDVSKC